MPLPFNISGRTFFSSFFNNKLFQIILSSFIALSHFIKSVSTEIAMKSTSFNWLSFLIKPGTSFLFSFLHGRHQDAHRSTTVYLALNKTGRANSLLFESNKV